MGNRLYLVLCVALVAAVPGYGQKTQQLPEDVGQLIVGIAKTWDSDRARIWCFNRENGTWKSAFQDPVDVLLGRTGLAWGRGALAIPGVESGPFKKEGDRKTPAGVFAIGKMFGYPSQLPAGSKFSYRQVGKYDAWIDDPKNPLYNQHYVAKPGTEPSWFQSQRMRLGDTAYKYKIEVRHNNDPAAPGGGSAIFFHIRRGPDRPTAGCTTMAEPDLTRVMTWLREKDKPHYVILPKAEYDRLQPILGLPEFR
ncbi:MAG: L,D-peptidoglycan transpeptidase YkuD (ErfK/YbiS/YcfS/YnhG family) [Verrucomicrobiales bacterium]|jgi:L,D-peptidoglycan transpeptidase YkuD (ErfK/YbiS/YcfS/YnhG family)